MVWTVNPPDHMMEVRFFFVFSAPTRLPKTVSVPKAVRWEVDAILTDYTAVYLDLRHSLESNRSRSLLYVCATSMTDSRPNRGLRQDFGCTWTCLFVDWVDVLFPRHFLLANGVPEVVGKRCWSVDTTYC
jgi:hypothetical protein